MCVCQRVYVCVSLTAQRREGASLCEGGLFLASHFFPPAAAKKRDRRPGNESWQRAIICLPHIHTHRHTHTPTYTNRHTHTHTNTQHLTALSNTRHGNGTAAIRGEEPFPLHRGRDGERNERKKERARERGGGEGRAGEGGEGEGCVKRNGTAQEAEWKREREHTIKR